MQNKNKRWERSDKYWDVYSKKIISLQNQIKEKFMVWGLKIVEILEKWFVENPGKWLFRKFGWLLPHLGPYINAWDDTEAWIIENWIIPSIIWFRNLSFRDRFRIFIGIVTILHMYFFFNSWLWLGNLFLSWLRGEFYIWPIAVEIAVSIREYWLKVADERMYFHPDNTFFPVAFILAAIFPYVSYRLAWRNALWMSTRGLDMLNCRPYGVSWFEELIETDSEELGVMLLFWVQQISYVSYIYAYLIGNALLTWHFKVLSGGRMRFAVWHALGRAEDFAYWNMTSQYYTYFLSKKVLKLPFKGDFAYSEALWDEGFSWYFPNRTYFEFGRVHTLDEVKSCYDFFLTDRAYHSFSYFAWYKTRMNDPFNIFGKTIKIVPWRERNLQNSFVAPWHSWLWHRLDRSGIESTRLQSIPHVIDSHSAFRLTCFKEGIGLDYAGWSPEETFKRALLDDTSWFYFWRGWARSRYIETCYQGKADPYFIAWMIAGPVRRHGFFGHANPHSWVPTVTRPNPKFDMRIALVSPCNPIIDSTVDLGALCTK